MFEQKNIPDQVPLLEQEPQEANRFQWLRTRAAVALSVAVGSLGIAGGILADSAAAKNIGSHPHTEHIVANPLPVRCPDPSALVTTVHPYNVEINCTSDRDQTDPSGSAFALYKTSNLRKVVKDGYIFPPGHEPWWALKSPNGEYWAPTISKIGKNYVADFAAQPNPEKVHIIQNGHPIKLGSFVLGVAWGKDIHHMYEHTRILHYIGETNNVPGSFQETFGGAIDPSVERDPQNGKLYLSYTEQPNRTMLTELTRNGLSTTGPDRLISHATLPWEQGVEEGSVLIWNNNLQRMTATLNAASTWAGTYKEGYLVLGADPMNDRVHKYDQPILQSGNGLYGPGMGSQPFLGPDGKSWFVYVHSQKHPDHNEMDRYLTLEPWHWSSGKTMQVPASAVTQSVTQTPNSQANSADVASVVDISVPSIGNGLTNRHVLAPFLQIVPNTEQVLRSTS